MNYSTAIFLINSTVRAVMCTYEAGDRAERTMFKTFDMTIKVDDLVIVPTTTRHNMTVCKVVETDVDVEFDTPTCVQWIIGKVDRATYDRILSEEALAISTIKSAEKTKKRQELRDAIMADTPELRALTISDTAAIPAPTPAPAPDAA